MQCWLAALYPKVVVVTRIKFSSGSTVCSSANDRFGHGAEESCLALRVGAGQEYLNWASAETLQPIQHYRARTQSSSCSFL